MAQSDIILFLKSNRGRFYNANQLRRHIGTSVTSDQLNKIRKIKNIAVKEKPVKSPKNNVRYNSRHYGYVR